MGLLTNLPLMLQDAVLRLDGFLNSNSNEQVKDIENRANSWRAPSSTEYLHQIGRRISYLDGNMASDIEGLAKKVFPETHDKVMETPFLLPLTKHIIEKRAKVFKGADQRFYLKMGDDEVPAEEKISTVFSDMLEKAGLIEALVRADRVLDLCHDCGMKVYWDPSAKCAKVDVVYSDMTHIAVNPWFPSSADMAQAIAFERSGLTGINSTMYEVWGWRSEELLDAQDEEGKIFEPTLHYIDAGKDGQFSVNELDANPYKDRRTGRPMYPLSWWQDYSGNLYSGLGGDDLVELNRALVLYLSRLLWGASWDMSPVKQFEVPPGDTRVKADLASAILSPDSALSLPPGVKLTFASPGFDPIPFTSLAQLGIQFQALTNHLSPRMVDIARSLPESGIALQVEMAGLHEYRAERIGIYKPHVIDMLNRLITVHNTFSDQKIPDELEPEWEPGCLDDVPVDAVAQTAQFEAEIAANVSSPIDWIQARYKLSRAEAEARFDENKEINSRDKPDPSEMVMPAFQKGAPFLGKKQTQDKKGVPQDEEQSKDAEQEDEYENT